MLATSNPLFCTRLYKGWVGVHWVCKCEMGGHGRAHGCMLVFLVQCVAEWATGHGNARVTLHLYVGVYIHVIVTMRLLSGHGNTRVTLHLQLCFCTYHCDSATESRHVAFCLSVSKTHSLSHRQCLIKTTLSLCPILFASSLQ